MHLDLSKIGVYYKQLKHQDAAIAWLEMQLSKYGFGNVRLLELPIQSLVNLQEKIGKKTMQNFTDQWRADSVSTEERTSHLAQYFSQIDNPILPFTTCNSSANAMLLKTLKPTAIADDAEYVRKVFAYGAKSGFKGNVSIYHSIHTKILDDYGLKTEWRCDLNAKRLSEELQHAPMVVNILHKGAISTNKDSRSCLGGGHMILLHTITNDAVPKIKYHDPFGAFDWQGGVYSDRAIGAGKDNIVSLPLFLARTQFGWRKVCR